MRICCLGSLNIDYVYTVEHFVRPGETLSAVGMETLAGGKGLNQSISLAKAGVSVFHAGRIGQEGVFLKDTLSGAGVDVSLVEIADGASGHAIIQVDAQAQNCILLYGGANRRLEESFVDDVLSHFAQGDILLLQNEINLLPYIIKKAYRIGMLIALNPSPFQEELKALPMECLQWLILNEVEGQEFTGTADPEEMIRRLRIRCPQAGILLTLGEKGAVYADAERQLRQGIFPVEAVDTTAAGDTFTGYFLAGILRGQPMEITLRQAARASAIAVSRHGAAQSIPTLTEVLAEEKETHIF